MASPLPDCDGHPHRFENRVVIITGGGSGIGRATALAFAREGAHVIVAGRRLAPLEQTVALIAAAGGMALACPADVTQRDQVAHVIATALESWGRLDILFNNAGVGGDGKPLCDIDESDFDEQLAVNAKGTWLGMKYAIPAMLASGGGCIVNNASVAGLVGWKNGAAYSAAKHAVVGLTRTTALEYGRQGIRVNAICPATHLTPMTDTLRQRMDENAWNDLMGRLQPATGRAAQPEEAAAIVLFLCSPAATGLHGVALPVDGGYTAR